MESAAAAGMLRSLITTKEAEVIELRERRMNVLEVTAYYGFENTRAMMRYVATLCVSDTHVNDINSIS